MPEKITQPETRSDGLQLADHRSYQERLWAVERWAWGAFLAIVLAAVLGFTGAGGVLSHRLSDVEGGQVDHPRFARWQANDDIVVHFPKGPLARSLSLAPSFAEAFQVEDIHPRPLRVETGPEGETLHFRMTEGGPARVILHVRPLRPGLARFGVSIDGGAPQELSSLILP
jgi:hypothetical protein